MPDINVKPVSESGIEMKADGTTIIFSGSINHPRPQMFMEPFIEDVHNSIVDNKIKEVDLDITDLRFLNSSGIREIVDWVLKMSKLPEDSKYKINFVCSREHKWQESSISTLIYLNQNYTNKVMKD
ncbi:MAG: anti-sigma factor antagonist [Spirochaetales bacterium]|nr:anti-sigma factor antagonist [Spirochaetales bacterium]